ncbi:MAG: NTP transferase domain-containing protein [Candidatus Omnitrophica bacterium]|nr:NTP transferase domain-containing protein [Candidatus Omnitrophota bacterium]
MQRGVVGIVLAAGLGTRMKSSRAKVLHEVFGRSLVGRVVDNVKSLRPTGILVVVGYDRDKVIRSLSGRVKFVWQKKQLGTGHALRVSERVLKGFRGNLFIVPGDMPLLCAETLRRFMTSHSKHRLSLSVLSARMKDPAGYGRIVRDKAGCLIAIREELDATASERMIHEVNTGIYCVDAVLCFRLLRGIGAKNKKKEFYLTDLVDLAHRHGFRIEAFPLAGEEEALGINDRSGIMQAHRVIRMRVLSGLMKNGVTIVDPETTWIADGARVGRDTTIHPFTYIEHGVRIGKHCEIGPFSKIRSGSTIKDGSAIGSFVEVVRSSVGKRTRIKHLSYIGDAAIGDDVNVGAGTITANFDGKKKSKTTIGSRALIGSDTVLVAPVSVGKGARTGAGCVVTKKHNVRAGDTVVGVPARSIKNDRRRKR